MALFLRLISDSAARRWKDSCSIDASLAGEPEDRVYGIARMCSIGLTDR